MFVFAGMARESSDELREASVVFRGRDVAVLEEEFATEASEGCEIAGGSESGEVEGLLVLLLLAVGSRDGSTACLLYSALLDISTT
jgi:hypothetical protein